MSALPTVPGSVVPAATTPRPARGRTGDRSRRHLEVVHDGRTATADRGTRVDRRLAPATSAVAWRRRTIAAVVVVCLVVLGLVATSAVLAPGGVPTAGSPAARTAVVEPGETVWDVAEANAPAGVATAEYAARIIRRNGLAGGTVGEWQVLRLP